MKVLTFPSFDRDYSRLPEHVQARVDKQLALLLRDPRHPSLNLKKMKGLDDIWECRVSEGYRLTLQIRDDICFLRRVGPHDVLKRP